MSRLYMLSAFTVGALLCSASVNAQDQTRQDPAEIVATVKAFIQAQANKPGQNLKIDISPPQVARLSTCTQLVPYFPQGQKLRSRVSVGVRCVSPQPWITFVPVTISMMGTYYVARQTIQPGQHISSTMLLKLEGDLLALPQDVVLDSAQIVDYLAAHRIPANTPLKASSLRNPESVQRGRKVKTVAHGSGFIATATARALESGAPGAQIQVRTETGQIISATVLDGNTVQVRP